MIAYFSSNQSVLTIYRLAFRAEMKSYPVQYEQQRNAGNWNKSLTHLDGTSYRSCWPRGFGARGYSTKSYTGKPLTLPKPVLTATKQAETYPVSDDPLSGSAWRSAASLRYGDRAGITNFMCEQKPYPYPGCQRLF